MPDYDVAIIGGGPAGSTAGALLKKYNPDLRVAIFEREQFPRDHVGESQLPPVSRILDEMGCWDKVEAANFPIKIGATYRWGKTPELWDFEFLPANKFVDQPRPAKFEGQRRVTAFQVDRAVYDQILLDHASGAGCEVSQPARVTRVESSGDAVTGLVLERGTRISARYYIDASGHSGILRRAMNVAVDSATALQNIAIWDYWQNAEWAVEIGVGGTRIQIMSLGYGWIWFIPLGPTRTSVGLVVPAETYKSSGKRPEELYREALTQDPLIAKLMQSAVSEGKLQTTKDWSFVARRMVGENWFLAGESAGFADPILSAGLTISQDAARKAAYTILELDQGAHEASWLKSEFELLQRTQIERHIRFADYWYTTNAQFTDLQGFTAKIAQDAGLDLSPDRAWAWIAQGGFIDVELGIGLAGFDLNSIRDMGEFLGGPADQSPLETNNVFRLNLAGASWTDGSVYSNGSISRQPRYLRAGKVLPLAGVVEFLVNILQRESTLAGIQNEIGAAARANQGNRNFLVTILGNVTQALEALISDGWVLAEHDASRPLQAIGRGTSQVHWNSDEICQPLTVEASASRLWP